MLSCLSAFVTEKGLYCYTRMPFGLKNAPATFLVNEVFKNQLGRNKEAYLDDMIVKSKESKDHVLSERNFMKLSNLSLEEL